VGKHLWRSAAWYCAWLKHRFSRNSSSAFSIVDWWVWKYTWWRRGRDQKPQGLQSITTSCSNRILGKFSL
jgi:hypothetical protein